jgi:CRP-like cAMP-binding protein
VSHPDQDFTPNVLLRALAPDDYALLAPHLNRVSLAQDQVLAPANQPVDYIYFPEGGIVSLTASTADDGKTEVGIVGVDGMTGIAVLLGSDSSPHETFVQVDSTNALRIGADEFRQAMAQSASLQKLLLRYVQAFLVQSAHSTVSNAHHHIEARLARWLLMCHDRLEGDEIRLTHEFMSMMIAAQRTGVTLCLHVLEGGGMIRSKRGRVEILDREKLVDLAGDAYGAPEAEYRRLIGPFGRSATGIPFVWAVAEPDSRS